MKVTHNKRKADTRKDNPSFWDFKLEISKRKRGILAQTGSKWGELKRGKVHPFFTNIVLYRYRRLKDGSCNECWVDASILKAHDKRRAARQRALRAERKNLGTP